MRESGELSGGPRRGTVGSWVTVRAQEIGGVVGKYGVEGVNENGQYFVDICAERGLFLLNTFFQHKMIHRYTWARGNERSMIDYIAVDNRLRREMEEKGGTEWRERERNRER